MAVAGTLAESVQQIGCCYMTKWCLATSMVWQVNAAGQVLTNTSRYMEATASSLPITWNELRL